MTIEDVVRSMIREELAAAAERTPREWLTPADVADELRLDVSTVYDKIRRGVLPSHRHDGRIYVSRGELNATIAASPSARGALDS